MNAIVQRRGERVTAKQKEIIVEFMDDHVEFARNKLLSVEGKITSNNLWQILCQQLNSNGPEKSLVKWQRVWTDIKIKVKRKASRIASSRRKTGGGPPDDVTLDDFDEKVIKIISETAVYGLHGPDNVPLDSEEPVPLAATVLQCNQQEQQRLPVPVLQPVPVTEPVPSTSASQWTHIVEEAERNIAWEEVSNNNSNHLISPACSTSTRTPTPRRTWKKTSVAAQAADELKELSRQSNQAMKEIGAQLKTLNKTMNVLMNQNETLVTERINTNTLLLRIARALEEKKK